MDQWQKLTLANLAKGRISKEFENNIVKQVIPALCDPANGNTATITITVQVKRKKIKFNSETNKLEVEPFFDINSSCNVKLPKTDHSSTVILEEGDLMVDSIMDDAQHPGLPLDQEEEDEDYKIIPINKKMG